MIISKNVPILKLDTEDALYEIQHIRHPIRNLSEFVSVKEFTEFCVGSHGHIYTKHICGQQKYECKQVAVSVQKHLHKDFKGKSSLLQQRLPNRLLR